MAALPFDGLPQEVLTVLPADPQAQLDLSHRIVAFAFAQKAAQVEAESHQLRELLQQRHNTIKAMERKVAGMEGELHDMAAKHKAAVEEQHRLAAERAALIDTVKRLNRDVTRLDHFKRNLMQHLTDDEQPGALEPSMAATDLSSERLVSEVLSSVGRPAHTTTSYGARGSGGGGLAAGVTPSTAFPASSSGRPAAGYGSTSPRASFGGAGTPASSASYGGPSSTHVDSKNFFKHAKERLSYEQFSQFLHNVKELNAGRQSREETLRRGRDIFGVVHRDLYDSFEALLSHHLTTF